MLAALVALAALAPPLPSLTLTAIDARGCGRIAVSGALAQGGPTELCVRQVGWAPLEGGLVVALVEAPHRFDARVRTRVFLYRLDGQRLVPRFLGSGFSSLDVLRLVPSPDALVLEVRPRSAPDAPSTTVRCTFDGFPLVCSTPEDP